MSDAAMVIVFNPMTRGIAAMVHEVKFGDVEPCAVPEEPLSVDQPTETVPLPPDVDPETPPEAPVVVADGGLTMSTSGAEGMGLGGGGGAESCAA